MSNRKSLVKENAIIRKVFVENRKVSDYFLSEVLNLKGITTIEGHKWTRQKVMSYRVYNKLKCKSKKTHLFEKPEAEVVDNETAVAYFASQYQVSLGNSTYGDPEYLLLANEEQDNYEKSIKNDRNPSYKYKSIENYERIGAFESNLSESNADMCILLNNKRIKTRENKEYTIQDVINFRRQHRLSSPEQFNENTDTPVYSDYSQYSKARVCLEIEDAKNLVKANGLSNLQDYSNFVRNNKDSGLPLYPALYYSGHGWSSYLDFFDHNVRNIFTSKADNIKKTNDEEKISA